MFIASIIAKVILLFFAANGFIRNLKKDASVMSDDERIASVAASITIFVGTMVLYFFAGVFNNPIG